MLVFHALSFVIVALVYFSHSYTVSIDDGDFGFSCAQSSPLMPKQLWFLRLVVAAVGVCSPAFSMLQLGSLYIVLFDLSWLTVLLGAPAFSMLQLGSLYVVLFDLIWFTVLLGAQGFRYAAT